MKTIACLLAATAAMATAADPQPPRWPTKFQVSGTFSMPHAPNLVEPFVSYESASFPAAQRLEWYPKWQGQDLPLDVYIYDQTGGKQYQVNPVAYKRQVCHEMSGDVTTVSMLPDARDMHFAGSGFVSGKSVNFFENSHQDLNKTSRYRLAVDKETEAPVSYIMDGYDSLIGSHFDLYVINYTDFKTGSSAIPAGSFNKPAMDCESFEADDVGPSMEHNADFLGEHAAHALGAAFDPQATHYRVRRAGFMVQALNRQAVAEGKSHRFELNHLASLPQSTLDKLHGARRTRRARKSQRPIVGAMAVHPEPTAEQVAALPSYVNWVEKGAVINERDQAACGSCWSFGASGTIEGQLFMKTGKLTAVAEQALMDCSWPFGNNACDGGNDYLGYEWILQAGGIPTFDSYGGYLAQDGLCHDNATGVVRAASLKGYVNVTSGSEAALMDAVANVGPISISINAALDSFDFYSEGVYDDPQCTGALDDLDHTVLLVGYGTENNQDYWLVRNSWSTLWGDGGYVKIARKGNICGVMTQPTYVKLA